ncbi:MAG: hypothetical protein IPG66_04625 [Hydrogenophilales bacterium]|nr:hypothetical protein [Hydrogenophilales bacterium]
MSKRDSGPPRRPRNPIAKDVRTPKYQQRVEPDKRWSERLKDADSERHTPDKK